MTPDVPYGLGLIGQWRTGPGGGGCRYRHGAALCESLPSRTARRVGPDGAGAAPVLGGVRRSLRPTWRYSLNSKGTVNIYDFIDIGVFMNRPSGKAIIRVQFRPRAWYILAILLFSGALSFVAAQSSDRPEPSVCGAFTIGRSAFGGCDGLGGPPATSTPTQRIITTVANLRYLAEQTLPKGFRQD